MAKSPTPAESNTNQQVQRTRAKQGAFLAAYAKTCNIRAAASAADMDRTTHYDWLKSDPEYAAMFAQAEVLAAQELLDAAVDKALIGWDEPVFHEGKACGNIRKRSDRLHEVLLKGLLPRFRERFSHEVTGKDGAPLMDPATWDALLKASRETDGQ